MHFRSSAEAVTFPLVNELIEKINSQNLLIQSERDVEWIFEASFLKNFQMVVRCKNSNYVGEEGAYKQRNIANNPVFFIRS